MNTSIRLIRGRRAPLVAALLLAFGAAAEAATISVTQDTDSHLFGLCSLREAMQSANDHAAPAGTNCVAGSGADDTVRIPFASISLSQGSLASTGTLRIEGTAGGGKTAVVRPPDAPAFPIFSVVSGDLTLQHLQISGGRADFAGYGGGGGISSNATLTLIDSMVSGNSSATNGGGGGIYSVGPLTLIDSTVSGNSAESATSWGGGIAAKYPVSVIDSTISGNSAVNAGGGMAIFGLANPTLMISNSTVAGNSVSQGNAGGIFVNIDTVATISNSTVAFNTTNASGTGAGIFVNGGNYGDGQLALSSTLVSGNLSGKYTQDIAAATSITVSGSRNLARVWSAQITLPNDTLTCSADVAALGDNGGPTQTVRLLANSCAIDGGARNTLQYDQRGAGFARVVGANADIGAFEYTDVIFANGFDGADP
ncbi:MAG TPA: choice-of-anchor Q domain-containing protein [Dokdonella sp.]